MRIIINRLPKNDFHMRAKKYPYVGLSIGCAPACNPGYALHADKQMDLLQDVEIRNCTVWKGSDALKPLFLGCCLA